MARKIREKALRDDSCRHALLLLAIMYEKGMGGLSQHVELAKDMYDSLENDFTLAKYRLAQMYEQRVVATLTDDERSVQMYTLYAGAANQGFVPAQLRFIELFTTVHPARDLY